MNIETIDELNIIKEIANLPQYKTTNEKLIKGVPMRKPYELAEITYEPNNFYAGADYKDKTIKAYVIGIGQLTNNDPYNFDYLIGTSKERSKYKDTKIQNNSNLIELIPLRFLKKYIPINK